MKECLLRNGDKTWKDLLKNNYLTGKSKGYKTSEAVEILKRTAELKEEIRQFESPSLYFIRQQCLDTFIGG